VSRRLPGVNAELLDIAVRRQSFGLRRLIAGVATRDNVELPGPARRGGDAHTVRCGRGGRRRGQRHVYDRSRNIHRHVDRFCRLKIGSGPEDSSFEAARTRADSPRELARWRRLRELNWSECRPDVVPIGFCCRLHRRRRGLARMVSAALRGCGTRDERQSNREEGRGTTSHDADLTHRCLQCPCDGYRCLRSLGRRWLPR